MNWLSAVELARAARDMRRAGRLNEAARLLKEALAHKTLDTNSRISLLSALCQAQVDIFSLDEADQTLKALAELDPQRAQVEGLWLDYYRGDLQRGMKQIHALADTIFSWFGHKRRRAYLVVGKILCEAHHLAASRDWLLSGLDQARAAGDIDQLASFAGALAEVLYRGGAFIQALELIELDAALLPPGSQYIDRLRTYRGHCYRQLGQPEAARSLYEDARQSAALAGRPAAYPLRGVLWCDLIDLAQGGDKHTLLKRINHRLDALRKLGEAYSLGLGLLGGAWALNLLEQNPAKSSEWADEAAAIFTRERYSFEAAWCQQEIREPLSLDSSPPTPPEHTLAACFAWLEHIPLSEPYAHWKNALHAFNRPAEYPPQAWMGIFF